MAARKPLVIINGLPSQLPAGDTLDASVTEVDVVGLTNGGAVAAPAGSPVHISTADTFQLSRANAASTINVSGGVGQTWQELFLLNQNDYFTFRVYQNSGLILTLSHLKVSIFRMF